MKKSVVKRATKIASHEMRDELIRFYSYRMMELVRMRNNLTRDDLEYVMEKVERMKDERLKACIAELVGWGDTERSEIETFLAFAFELMKLSTPSRIEEAVRINEIRFHLKNEQRRNAGGGSAPVGAGAAEQVRVPDDRPEDPGA